MKTALNGVKVVAFIQGQAGPMVAAIMASYGAEVIRVESRTRLEWHRLSGPFIDDIRSPDRSGEYLWANPSMLGLTLNIKHPRASEVLGRLTLWADAVVENFAGGVMKRLGLGYEDLREIRPDIIMLSTSMYGQTGPFASVRGYGGTLTSLTGIAHLSGFPDQHPQLPGFAITDYIAPRASVMALITALDYRRRTGKGQYIDAAQMETVLPLLAPVLLQYQTNGVADSRIGNRTAHAAPHGVYRCRGDERWCAITVFDDAEWRRFCDAIDQPDWTNESRFGTRLSRHNNEDALDALVETWTSRHTPEEVTQLMQEAGIAAGTVKGARELDTDPQLMHRGFYHRLHHPDIGEFTYNGQPVGMSRTPYEIRRAPTLGEHNEEILMDRLGMSKTEYTGLVADGVLD